MSQQLVVQPHFHRRRTGITSHVENLLRARQRDVELRGLGTQLSDECPKITWAELWRRSHAEVVVWHAHRNLELLVGWLLTFLGCRLMLVFTRHDNRPPGRYTRWLFRRAHQLVTLSETLALAARHPSRIIGHGVDVERFRPPDDRSASLKGLELGGGPHAVGVIGRVRPDKGQGDFASAIAPLLDAHPDWVAVLVGLVKPGEARWAQTLRELTGGRLRLLGEQRDMPRWYQGLEIVVQPSHAEAYSMVVLEGMASGCCVVASRVGTAAEVIADGETGFLFDPHDAQKLRAILSDLLANPARRAHISAAASRAARERHSLQREVAQLSEVYLEVAHRALARVGR